MPILSLTEPLIHAYGSERNFEQAQIYYLQGAVNWLIQRGDTLYSEVKATQTARYYPTIQCYEEKILTSRCTCRFGQEERNCEHILATLLKYFYEPPTIETRPTLKQSLTERSALELQTLLITLANQYPKLLLEIEERLLVSSPTESKSRPLVQIENREFRTYIRKALSYGFENDLVRQWFTQVTTFLDSGETYNALNLLTLLTEEAIQQAQYYRQELDYQEDKFIMEFFAQIDKLWATIFLSLTLTPVQMEYWNSYLQQWQLLATDAPQYFRVALASLQYGWDYSPLQAVLQGEFTETIFEAEEEEVATSLVEIYLHLLSTQQRYREFLALAKAQQHHSAYLWMLWKLKRKSTAVVAVLQILWKLIFKFIRD